MSEALAIVAVPVVVAILLAALIRRRWPAWSHRRGVLWAAAPVPVFAAAVAAYVLVAAATATQEACGVDACGMATVAAAFVLAWAVAAFLLGAIAAAAVLRDRRAR